MSKIDYEITVDVSKADIKTKKRVQDAFFKLGITWWDGDGYLCLDKGCYTNTFMTGIVSQDLMWADYIKNPTHTIEELMELVGMKNEANLKLFDLERALRGEPVVLRNGNKAYIRHHETELETDYPLIGYRVYGNRGSGEVWSIEGNYFDNKEETASDIMGMWHEPLVFENWDLLSEGIKYLAKDSTGYWYAYSGKPTEDEEGWMTPRHGGCYSVAVINPSLFPECDWENSLIERPEK